MGKLTVVYDVDDTLWNLNSTICDLNKINFKDLITYNPLDNIRLSEEEKTLILQAYSDPAIFRQCKFYDGCDRLFNLEVANLANVWISSANLSKEVLLVKLDRLQNEILNINMEHVKLTCSNSTYQGRVQGDILIDDSPINIAKSDFAYNILLDKPYNRDCDSIVDLLQGKTIVRATSLSEAIDLVEMTVSLL